MAAIKQLGYMVHDLDAAIDYWIDVMGAGPFFLADIEVPKQDFLGEPTNALITVAIGYSGDMQVELIRQTNDAASAYIVGLLSAEDTPVGGHFHHVLMSHDGYDAACRKYEAAGGQRTFNGWTEGLGRYCYIDARNIMGCHIELMEPAEIFDRACAAMHAAHCGWDGEDRRRSFEELLN